MRIIDTRCNCCSKAMVTSGSPSASSGNEAIALLEKQKFSLVLLDLMKPDLNGDEVLKLIKSDPDKRDIPVIMLSADTDAEKVAQCIELGADDYLPKPFNPTILRARIAAALRREGAGHEVQTTKSRDDRMKRRW